MMREVTDGETWTWHPQGGVIFAHPQRKPTWCRFVNGVYVETDIEPAMTISERVEATLFGDVRHRDGDFLSVAAEVLSLTQDEVDVAVRLESSERP